MNEQASQELPEISRLKKRVEELEAQLAGHGPRESQSAATPRLQEEHLATLLDAATQAIFLIDPSGTILAANKALATGLHTSPQGLIGRNINGFFSPDVARRRYACVQQVVKTGKPVSFEDQRDTIPFASHFYPVFDENGQVHRVAIFSMEISRRKQMEELLQARLRLNEAAAALPLEALLQKVLKEAETLTGSSCGFACFLKEDQQTLSLQIWSSSTLPSQSKGGEREPHHKGEERAIWSDCLHQRGPIIHNDCTAGPHRKDLPIGDAPVKRELAVPVFRGERIVAVFGVGNKEQDYGQEDIKLLSILGDMAWDFVLRKQDEERLRQSEERFRNLLNNIPSVAVQGYTEDGTVHYWNQASEQLYGYSAQKAIGRNLLDLIIPPEMRAEVQGAVRRMAGTGQPLAASELSLMRRDGSRVAVFSSHAIVHLPGHVPELFCMDIDLTGRKQAEEALRESEENFRSLAESSPDYITRYDRNCRHLYLNPAAARILGRNATNILGKPLRATGLPEEKWAFLEEQILRVFRSAQPCHKEHDWNRVPDTLSLDWRFTPEFDATGGVHSVLGVARDITERKRIENVQAFLAHTSTGLTDEPFFNALARYLAQILGMDYACIEQLEGDGLRARTVAVWHDGHFEDNLTHDLKDTPSGAVAGKTVCCFPASVQQFFPHDQVLEKLQAESYAGVTLWDHSGQPLGLIAVIGRHPLVNRPLAETILQLVAGRAAGELERLRVRESLQTTLKRFQIILSSLYPGLLVVSDEGRVEFVNQSFCDLFELKKAPEALIGMPPAELIKNRIHLYVEPRKALARIRTLVEQRRPVREEEVAIRGERTYLRDFIPIVIDGKQYGRLWHHYDITGRKRAEAALRKSEQRFRSYFEMGLIGMATVSVDKRFMHLNDRLCEILGYPREELVQKSWSELTHPDDLPADLIRFDKILRGDTDDFLMEKRYLRKDGSIVHTDVSARCIRNENGSINHLVVMVQDITNKKQAEEKARKLQAQVLHGQKMEAIGTLAGGIAHDFNNILAAVIGYADMARMNIPDGSPLARDLDQVLKAGHRAKDLVRQILVFSRQTDTEPIRLYPINIVKEVIKLLRPSLPSTIAIEHYLHPEAGPVQIDPTQLHQILMNLCTNAFHAMEASGGTLTLSLKTTRFDADSLPATAHAQPGPFIALSVGDSGPGIPAGIRDRIFDPFFTTKELGKGTGMGLSIVHGIVTSSGGFITLDSTPGQGSVFHIYLPVVAKESFTEDTKAEPIPAGSEHLLFIDDEEILASMAQTMLERLGYKVTVRTNSLEALTTFQNHPGDFDLVITDQTMPGLTGTDLAQRMLQIRPDIPIILCTGYSTLISAETAKAHGIREFALKPLTQKDLAMLIRKTLNPA